MTRRKLRASDGRDRPLPSGPVHEVTVDPWLWQIALKAADGDVHRLVIYSRDTVAVYNSEQAARRARRARLLR